MPRTSFGFTTTFMLSLLVAAGCTQAPTPQVVPESPAEPHETSASAPTADESQEGADAEGATAAPEKKDDSVIVIESAKTGRGKSTLWEAAVAARESRKTAQRPVASVTNENLHEYQDAELTFAEPSEEPEIPETTEGEGTADAPGAAEESADDEEPTAADRGEQYWKDLVLDIRLRLRAAVDEIEELEGEVESLRRSFYAEDDPYIRDGRIKPAWDRAIGRLASTRRRVRSLRQELAEALEDGRRAGALAGWLREGIELEPSYEEQREASGEADGGGLSIHESREPDTVEPHELPNTNPDEPPR